jgi:hypothetical protein
MPFPSQVYTARCTTGACGKSAARRSTTKSSAFSPTATITAGCCSRYFSPDEGSEAVEIFFSGETGYVEELVEDDDRLGSGALDRGAEPLVNGDVDRQETAEGIDHQDVLRLRGSRWRTERQEQGEVGRGDAQRTGSPREKPGCGWCWRTHGAVGGTHVAELQCRNRRVCMQIRKASSHRRSGSDDGQEASRRQGLVLPACSARPGRTRHAIRRDRRA